LTSKITSPLSAWINRNHPLPERFYQETFEDIPDEENWSVWVSLEETCLLHDVGQLNWLSLKDSIKITHEYLETCGELITGLEGAWLDGEEQIMILEEIGEPPIPCLPIYMIAIKNDREEKIVYIGKTKSDSRFNGGHTTAIKLHHPKYKDYEKIIYRCSIWFHFNDEYIVLDWVKPESLGLKLLDSIESQMIFDIKPELNVNKVRKNYANWEFTIHIQNLINGGFMNDYFIWQKK